MLRQILIGIILIVCFVGCSLLEEHESELTRLRATGELRKGCRDGKTVTFQPKSRVNTTVRLVGLRKLMKNETVTRVFDGVDAYIVPSQDEHQTEFVQEYDKRREFISGFSGSAGDAIITSTKAVLWTDSRYHLQADEQLDCNWLLMRQNYAKVPTIAEWLKLEFPHGARLGVDPKLISQFSWEQYSYELEGSKINLTEINTNLIDVLWTEGRYRKRSKDAFVQEERFAGKPYQVKLAELRRRLKFAKSDAMVVTALDEIAWLLNVRGRDIPFSPFLRSYALVDEHNVRLYVNASQLVNNKVDVFFSRGRKENKDNVEVVPYDRICEDLHTLTQAYKRILVPTECVYSLGASRFINNCVPDQSKIFYAQSPIIYMKAVKNPTEVRGMERAHIRDAAAMCEFFSYFDSRVKAGTVFTELEIVKMLNEFRFEQKNSLGNSFRTIVGYGPNGAQPHYEPTPPTNAKILDNSTLVIDSGGQYYDGTTDVTRTIHLGNPTQEQKEAYTRVLMGQIQLATLTFPKNLRTSEADAIVRAPLWEVGLDYFHGSGHGVGSFLAVHESPIAMQFDGISEQLKPNYFLSIEPGVYVEGDFGVRLENVMQVTEKRWLKDKHNRPFLGFKVVTLVPYEPKLIDYSLLTPHHRRWLNDYNARIRTSVGAELKKQNLMKGFYWMMDKTASIPEHGTSSTFKSQPFLILSNILLFSFISSLKY